MGDRWIPIEFRFLVFLVPILVILGVPGCWSLNGEGLALLAFRKRVASDPHGALADWNPNDTDPCRWSGVHCVDGHVQTLDLSDLSLEGTLAPELGKLGHVKSLVLYKNSFSGTIPPEIEELTNLELLDLRNNNLSGKILVEIGRMLSLKHLLLCGNKLEGSIITKLESLKLLSALQLEDNSMFSWGSASGCIHRKLGQCYWQSNFKELKRPDSLRSLVNSAMHGLNYMFLSMFNHGNGSPHGHGQSGSGNLLSLPQPGTLENEQNLRNSARRRLLEASSNLPAVPANPISPSDQVISLPSMSSGSYPAVDKNKSEISPPPSSATFTSSQTPIDSSGNPPPAQSGSSSSHDWKYVGISAGGISLLFLIIASVFKCRSRGVPAIVPWKTGLSGQLQKAFITGAPKLNRPELEMACEDFSNIIDNFDGCTMYKGTLSSGVEIAVASTSVSSFKGWSKNAERAYRKKIDMLSRANHKNFVNLLGYCDEEEPFTRMMVFEYAPNGTVSEHVHVEEVEHLDWNARVRIIMGTAYCLQYMHHDLNPPVAHSNLNSSSIYLTDDYAAKVAENVFSSENVKLEKSGENDSENSVLPPLADPETNVYSFGILLLEIISGKLPYSEEQGPLVNWASEYLNDKKSISYMIDPSLKSFKDKELDVICEVIKDCINPDPRMRPTMKEITSKLREVIGISPEQAVPRLSPLWWAELEILSSEAA